LSVVSLAQMNSQLPVIAGVNAFQLQLGRRVELPQVQAALQLIAAFARSPMAGLVDLRRVDVSAPGVVVATTGQGSEVTFGLNNLDQQLRRWRQIYDYALSRKSNIAAVDLAVANNVPVRLVLASAAPESVTPKAVKPAKNRRKNV
jgi:curli biogenesis system outer membrane secretion channel CsgG